MKEIKNNISSLPGSGSLQAMQGGGITGELIRNFDWSKTSLGESNKWPQSLQSALGICINSNFPIAIYWGPELVLLYNDAWSPIPGNKHPWALGKPAKQVWPEIWNDIEPQFMKAFSGTPGGSKDALLPMQRHGYTEECYFDFTFTPIYGESGKVDGIFNAVIETTYRVINERRATLLQKLSDSINAVTTKQEVFSRTSIILDEAVADVSFYGIYQPDDAEQLTLVASSKNFSEPWPFSDTPHHITHVEDLVSLGISIPAGQWPEPPSEAVLAPLKASDGSLLGYILGGLSPRRKFDKDYKSFFESLSAVIAGELNTINALNEQIKRAEALAQIDKAKTVFFSNISHEFRTPLTLILSPLESILESGTYLPEKHRNDLEISMRNTIRLQKLVNTLLDFSRIEAGKMYGSYERVDIGKLTRELASSFRSAIESAGIKYTVQEESINSNVFVDVEMWEKIVLNLISNAFKYTKAGEISVRILERNSRILLEIKDTGIGIPEHDREKIFERFYRVNNAGGRSQEGTGIGLSMVKELVSIHQGEIKVESTLNLGSVFTVSIPVGIRPGAEQKFQTRNNEEITKLNHAFVDEAIKWSNGVTASVDELKLVGNGNLPKVLLADDNADMRDYVYRLLSQQFEVQAVANGEEAFKLALEWLPELILSDIMMPQLDGFGLLRKLKSNLATRNIPLIFLSARAGDEAKVEGITAGADDYLIKPFSAKELLARVQNHIVISRTRRETEKQFYNLFLQSPAHIHVMKGPDHIIEFFHPLAKPFVGERDLTGMKIREALPEMEGKGYFEMLDQVYHEGKSFYLPESKVLISNKAGMEEEYFFNITYLPWRDSDNKIQGVFQFTFDVTAQAKANNKLRESEERLEAIVASRTQELVSLTDDLKTSNRELSRSNDDLQQFAHVTSHDLKEPVRKIKMYENLLRENYKNDLPAKGLAYLDKIENAVGRISTMIEGILNYSSVDAVQQSFEKIDLNHLLKNIKEDLEVPIRDSGAVLAIGTLPNISGSHTLLYQLFYNILKNALKFIRKGEQPLIEVSQHMDSSDEDLKYYYRIDITDNGIGFDQAYADKIFESFMRLNPKDKFEGTGLGLALCKKIAERHNGFIKARGELNKGATFSIYLPIHQKTNLK